MGVPRFKYSVTLILVEMVAYAAGLAVILNWAFHSVL
ncbi:hypothetical protein Desdi_2759 [Desulfitobacterium dichloroeliminans LMG P-21439]|uniref:Uncharacterized protein n=1 Tax=Desulfitobacterium dichloroeliminans (strain LMG P-21439 / DCA1) TaxID=871963 RepID=L0FB55_DESDL|nr:hypothetical protein Desdi_2759 [Desulfitobacterium dichloroeliminans LMG P-21439]